MILKTERTYMRRLTQNDYDNLCTILQDSEVMYTYEGAFSNQEVQEWLDKQLNRYSTYGFGLWAVCLKENDEVIGQCGLTMQDLNGKQVLEIGYLFRRKFWHQGYATECATACKKYAFDKLGAEKVYSIIRDTNIASQKVAIRNNLSHESTFVKHYKGVTMPHYVYSISKEEYLSTESSQSTALEK